MAFTAQLATADSRLGNIVLGFGSSAQPIYTGTIDVTIAPPTMTSSWTFVAPVYSATINVTIAPPTMVSAWTFVAPVYSATIDVTVRPPTMRSEWQSIFSPVFLVAILEEMHGGGY